MNTRKTQIYYSHSQKGSKDWPQKPFLPQLITNVWNGLPLSFHKSSKSSYQIAGGKTQFPTPLQRYFTQDLKANESQSNHKISGSKGKMWVV